MTREELLQTAKPIIFNTEMVRAILDDRKTVTRRIWKDWNRYAVPDMSLYDADKKTYAVHTFEDPEHIKKLSMIERRCPICPGDILYVRETWKKAPNGYYYYEDWQRNDIADITKWKPSIHMPKEAARIWLKVTDVRVERLHDITDDEAEAEGANFKDGKNVGFEEKMRRTSIERFIETWNSTIKKSDLDTYGWDANPWVWVIEFERIEV